MEQQENELEQARREIDAVDAEMAALFCRRMDAVRRVAAYKQARGCLLYTSMALHTQGKGLQPLQQQKSIERRDGRARIPKQHRADIGDQRRGPRSLREADAVVAGVGRAEGREPARGRPIEPAALHNDAAQRRAVPADKFCCRMHHHIRAVFNGAQQVGRCLLYTSTLFQESGRVWALCSTLQSHRCSCSAP